MTSIFNSYYGQNLLRLNASAKAETSEKKAKPAASEKGEQFAKVLADLEGSKSHNRKAAAAEQITEKPQIPTLSNFTDEEAQVLPSPAESMEKSSIRVQDAKADLRGANYYSVNFSSNPEKMPAPEILASPLPPQGPPQAPRIAEINREDFIKPSAPKLASVERVQEPVQKEEVLLTHREAMKDIITTAGKFYGIDPNLGMAVAQVESAFQPTAVSKDGHASKGIFQLLDTTGRHMMDHTGVEGEDYDPFDPAQNAYLGVGYLRRLHDIFSAETHLGGNMKTIPARSAEQLEKLAVAAFNTGEGNVARAQARARSLGKDPSDFAAIEPYLPASTRRYVQKVSQLRQAFAAEGNDTETA